MGDLSRRAVLAAFGGAAGVAGSKIASREPAVGGGGVVYDDPIFVIPSGDRYSTDGGTYEAIRWQTDAGLALIEGSKLTLSVEA